MHLFDHCGHSVNMAEDHHISALFVCRDHMHEMLAVRRLTDKIARRAVASAWHKINISKQKTI
jgi:hypothetical protein